MVQFCTADEGKTGGSERIWHVRYVYGYGHFRPGMIMCICTPVWLRMRVDVCTWWLCTYVCVGRGDGWHGASPSVLQRWLREQINYLKASCYSLSTSALLISMRFTLMHLTHPFYFKFSFCDQHHIAVKVFRSRSRAPVLWLLITATTLNLVMSNTPDWYFIHERLNGHHRG